MKEKYVLVVNGKEKEFKNAEDALVEIGVILSQDPKVEMFVEKRNGDEKKKIFKSSRIIKGDDVFYFPKDHDVCLHCAGTGFTGNGKDFSKLNDAYIAGLFDAEGSIHIFNNGGKSMYLGVSITNSHAGVINEIYNILGYGYIVTENMINIRQYINLGFLVDWLIIF